MVFILDEAGIETRQNDTGTLVENPCYWVCLSPGGIVVAIVEAEGSDLVCLDVQGSSRLGAEGLGVDVRQVAQFPLDEELSHQKLAQGGQRETLSDSIWGLLSRSGCCADKGV